VAADGLGRGLRRRLSTDEPVSSAYVAYRGAVPLADLPDVSGLALDGVVVYIGPHCHLVQYALHGGEVFKQVAVFRSPRALAGEPDRGTLDELDAAFAGTCDEVRSALPGLWSDSLVAHVRPGAPHRLGGRAAGPDRRRRTPDAAVPGAGCLSGDR
jgi:salicylate hydroxylase